MASPASRDAVCASRRLAGRVALVTGAAGGIGAAAARRFVSEGARVVVTDMRDDQGAAVAAELGERAQYIHLDVRDQAAWGNTVRAARERFGSPPTILVHNAGVIRPALLPDVVQDDLQALMQLHLGAALTLMQTALPAMKRNRFGRVVLMSSRGALGLETRSAYSATKAGMIGMARTWALELAPDGITVNVAAPGPIADTEMFRSIVPKDSEREKALAAAIPVKRLGRSADVARAVMVLLRPG